MSSDATAPVRTNLQRLFAPTSVAVVGASGKEGKVGYQAILALAEFPGEVFLVNPKSSEVLGRKTYSSLREVGHAVDLVIFALPALACIEAAREAVACNAGGGLILSSGFAEAGPAGEVLQRQLDQLRSDSEFRILGPNTAGFINKTVQLTASFVSNATRIPRGTVAVVAQSAGVNFTVSFLMEQLGVGVSVAVGLGNAVDVSAADVLEFLVDDPNTRAIALHLEGVPDGRRLYEVLRRVTAHKPVVALTVGKGRVGEFARSHTGNLIGSYDVRRAALVQAGAIVVDTTDELAAAAAVLSIHRLPPKVRPGVGLLTAQAGPALLALDQLRSNDISVPELEQATVNRIAELLPPLTHMSNPVDTGRPSPTFGEVLQVVADDERIDLVAAYALHEPAAIVAEEVLPGLAARITKPVLFATQGPAAEVAATVGVLRSKGMYVATSPEQLAWAAQVLTRDAQVQHRLIGRGEPTALVAALLPESNDERAIKTMLGGLGIAAPRGIEVSSLEDARLAMRQLSKPVVVKILSEEITHKTEVGGVQMNIDNEVALQSAIERLDAIELAGEHRYLLEEMAPPGLELIVGAIRDPSFGPTVVVGLGGTRAEALKDTATRLAPLTLSEAHTMLGELRASVLFDGWRGGPRLDREAVAHAIVRVGDVLCQHPSVNELEVNPLRVYETGVLALDAAMTRA